jgi:ABC-type sugar transport system ATPase subunit
VSVHALKDVDMELHEGELLVLLGNAGSSTLKLAVAGAPEPASSGAWQAAPHGALLK